MKDKKQLKQQDPNRKQGLKKSTDLQSGRSTDLEHELQQAQALNHFYALWAHEMRSPLIALQASLNKLKPSGLSVDVSCDHQAWLTAQSASQLLDRALNDLLSLGQFEAEHLVIQNQVFDLNDVWEHLNGLVTALIGNKPIEWQLQPIQKELLLCGDAFRLQQILINLLSNAVKFTADGQISLSVTPPSESNHQAWCFEVADTGEGMTSEQVAQLFQPYRQFIQTKKSNQTTASTGLGLVVVKELVDAMAGQVQVWSQPGLGTCIEVCLPWAELAGKDDSGVNKATGKTIEASLQKTAESRVKPGVELTHIRLLIADDSELSRTLLANQLEDQAVQITMAKDGLEALSLIKEQEFDYLLLDHFMPGLDGESVCRQVRKWQAEGRHPQLKKIILMSAEPLTLTATSRCSDLVLIKPISQKQLFELFKRPSAKLYKKFKKSSCKNFIHGKIPNELTQLIPNFVREIRQDLSEIEQTIATRDSAELDAKAHRLKGSFMLFQLPELAQQVDELVILFKQNNVEQAIEQLNLLRNQAQVLSDYAEEHKY